MNRVTRTVRLTATAMAVAVRGTAAAAAPAGAETLTGRDYGKHVVEHHGRFNGTHDPGVMHRGFSGWEARMMEHQG